MLASAFADSAFAFKDRKDDPGNDGDEGESAELDWQHLAGSRLRRSLRFLGSASQQAEIRIMAMVLDPLRVLHSKFRRWANRVRVGASIPAILNEVFHHHSTVQG